jgi:hypothetical protein
MRFLCRELGSVPGELDVWRHIAFDEYVKTQSPFELLLNEMEEEDAYDERNCEWDAVDDDDDDLGGQSCGDVDDSVVDLTFDCST